MTEASREAGDSEIHDETVATPAPGADASTDREAESTTTASEAESHHQATAGDGAESVGDSAVTGDREDDDGDDNGDGDDEEEEEDEDEDEDDDDDEPKLKYARLTPHLGAVYRNGDATSSFLVAGDKMVRPVCSISFGGCSTDLYALTRSSGHIMATS